MMRKNRSKVRITMNTYRNKQIESIALNPGDGKISFSHQSLLCARGVHTFCMEITQTDQPGSGVHK